MSKKNRATVEIRADGPYGTFLIDGKEIQNHVTGFSVKYSAGELPKVTFEVIAKDAVIELQETETEVIPKTVLIDRRGK